MSNPRAVIFSSPASTPESASVQSLLNQYRCNDFKIFDTRHADKLQPGTLYITTLEPDVILQAGVSIDKAIIVFRNTRSPAMKP